ncbi:MAG: hypothetical protein ABIC68_04030 [Candidatus Omnitrophota bacterium]
MKRGRPVPKETSECEAGEEDSHLPLFELMGIEADLSAEGTVSTGFVETAKGLLRGLQAIPLKGDRSSDGVRTTPEGRSPYGISCKTD